MPRQSSTGVWLPSLLLLCAAATAPAAYPREQAPIVVHILEIEGNTIEQPESLANLLKPGAAPAVKVPEKEKEPEKEVKEKSPATGASYKMAGYRVQIFSDGNQRTAKEETRRKASAVSRRFPAMRTYSSYSAPYWRLRVGDFKTRKEAEDAAAELRAAFPAHRHEIRVVRDRINARD